VAKWRALSADPLQPYRAQGAAIAVEDAAVIGALFSYISSLSQIPALLQAYQDLRCAFTTPPHPTLFHSRDHCMMLPPPKKRLPRATATQESSRLNQKIFHLPDGTAQRARDDAMRAAMAAELEGDPIPDGNPNQWADRTKNRAQFDYDADAEVERWWMGGGRRRIEALGAAASPGTRMMVKSRL
jgi:salicylate hydroxylase